MSYLKTYDSYRAEEDLLKRSELFDKTQRQMNMSGAFIISGAALWAARIVWVAITPNKYKPLQHVKLSFDPLSSPYERVPLISLRYDF